MKFTDAPYFRSHSKHPRGRGSWAFQETSTEYAYEANMIGDVWFAPGSLLLAQAKKAAREHFAGAEFVAVLP